MNLKVFVEAIIYAMSLYSCWRLWNISTIHFPKIHFVCRRVIVQSRSHWIRSDIIQNKHLTTRQCLFDVIIKFHKFKSKLKFVFQKKEEWNLNPYFKIWKMKKCNYHFSKNSFFELYFPYTDLANCLNFVFDIEVNTKSNHKILYFNLSKTRNGSLGTRIFKPWSYGVLMSPAADINFNIKTDILYWRINCSRSQLFFKIAVLKNFANFTGISNPLNLFLTLYSLFNMLFHKTFLSTFLDDAW